MAAELDKGPAPSWGSAVPCSSMLVAGSVRGDDGDGGGQFHRQLPGDHVNIPFCFRPNVGLAQDDNEPQTVVKLHEFFWESCGLED